MADSQDNTKSSSNKNESKSKRQALEDSFFAGSRANLRERLRAAAESRSDQMEHLAALSGIEDVALLEKLVLLGLGEETLAALTLYPLVAVAWADGSVDAHERQTVLEAAEECGLEKESVSYQLLAEWLEHAPNQAMMDAWKSFVAEISTEGDDQFRKRLPTEILSRARAVANASGGFLALDKTSNVEQRVIEELIAAFQ